MMEFNPVSAKIKVLHVAEAPGGVERYLVTLLTKLKQYKQFEHILVCSDSYNTEKFEGIVSHLERVSDMHNAISAREDLASIRAVRKLIKKYKPDIVYCHSSKAGAIGRIADIGINNKMLYNAHGWSFNMRGTSTKKLKLYEKVEKFLALMTDTIVCISDYERISALEHGICRNEKLKVIYNGIDFDEYQNITPKSRTALGIPEKAFVVGTVGRLTLQKAPDVFVNMAIEVKKAIPEAFFIFVGDGTQRDEIDSAIESAGLTNSFLITGWVDDPLDYMSCFDVATLLSRWEGFGLVLPEYMILGKPVVGTKVDAIPEVVGEACLLVDSEDYKSAAESAIRLYLDEELRSRMIENGKNRVNQFNAQMTADEHANLFRSRKVI